MYPFENKLVAVMNKSIETGKIMNALAHMCIGFGAGLGRDVLNLVDYQDKSNNVYPDISKMPFIILNANSNKINNLRKSAIIEGIQFSVFTDTMTVGTWEEQLARTKETTEENINFMGIVICGEWGVVTELTKKFSLWK
ncbi:MAG: DUF2000 domain-containing protein [Gammaproteobacteria bacterium]|jgi:hypothetical protein|nr:DUF2000 domain-containing protein [Gammaproteobacteria bacterium]